MQPLALHSTSAAKPLAASAYANPPHPAACPVSAADPLGLGANEERLKWFAESERVHCRWAMLGVAGILAQELVRPDVFWYTSGATLDLPFDITGLVGFELFVMHWVESRRGYDVINPGSQDQDPVFSNFKLPSHEVGYPGGVFAPFVPGNLEELKLKEIKNGRLAMLAFIGFTMAAQTTGLNPLAALGEHLSDPLNTSEPARKRQLPVHSPEDNEKVHGKACSALTPFDAVVTADMFAKAAVVPGAAFAPPCKIPDTVTVQGLTIPAGCFLQALWP